MSNRAGLARHSYTKANRSRYQLQPLTPRPSPLDLPIDTHAITVAERGGQKGTGTNGTGNKKISGLRGPSFHRHDFGHWPLDFGRFRPPPNPAKSGQFRPKKIFFLVPAFGAPFQLTRPPTCPPKLRRRRKPWQRSINYQLTRNSFHPNKCQPIPAYSVGDMLRSTLCFHHRTRHSPASHWHSTPVAPN